jgi:hypothetical protein
MSSSDYWTKVKPIRSGQLYLRDIQKLPENTELIAHAKPNFGQIMYEDISEEIANSKALPIQFIKARILDHGNGDKYWHIRFRTLDGTEHTLDLGNYGAVRWQGKYGTCRWLTLKEQL